VGLTSERDYHRRVKIPNRFHFVWTGRKFPYFARLAIESALLADPDANVVLHWFGPEEPRGLHVEAVRRRARVAIVRFDEERGFHDIGVDPRALRALFAQIPATAASARSNLIRYAVLAKHGGIYLDTDILVVRTFDGLRDHEAFAGEERVLAIDNAWQRGDRSLRMAPVIVAWLAGRTLRLAAAHTRWRRAERYAQALERHWQVRQLNNAVLGARPHARFIQRVLERALEVDPTVRYNLGPALVDQVARVDRSDVTVLPERAFYMLPPSYSFRFFTGGRLQLPDDARVLHVVSSNHRELYELDELALRRRRADGPYYEIAARVASRAVQLPVTGCA
jgi:hypothetical protein